jgi:hypothetical protein
MVRPAALRTHSNAHIHRDSTGLPDSDCDAFDFACVDSHALSKSSPVGLSRIPVN